MNGILEGRPEPTTRKASMETLFFFEEVSAAVQQLKCGHAPGVDGLPVEFYQRFWTVTGKGLWEEEPSFLRYPKRGSWGCWKPGDLSPFVALTIKYSPKYFQTDSRVVWRRSYSYGSFFFSLGF